MKTLLYTGICPTDNNNPHDKIYVLFSERKSKLMQLHIPYNSFNHCIYLSIYIKRTKKHTLLFLNLTKYNLLSNLLLFNYLHHLLQIYKGYSKIKIYLGPPSVLDPYVYHHIDNIDIKQTS